MTKDILKTENNFFLMLMCILVLSCSDSKEKRMDRCNKFVNANFSKYHSEYKTLNDSITMYVDSFLNDFLHIYGEEWEIDSMICINSSSNRFVTTLNNSNGVGKDCVMDAINKILGKKINNKWYFLQGANLVVPRDMYGKDAMHPLSFHELSQIARTEFLSGALVKGKNGKYVVDDKWVDEHFYNLGWGRFKDTAKYDSVHWFYITDKWKHKIDTNQYKPLRKNKNSDVAL